MAITRNHTTGRMSQCVVHGDTVYLAGQVANDPETGAGDQTRQVLEKIDGLLAEVGSDKSKLLSAQIWLTDIRDFAAMNEAWDAWVPEGQAPARATGEVRLARPEFRVEIIVVAAK
ncbi:MAG: RidA family protein [Alphaproteobacteria bacterium]|jgi:enamine deaminase RidA (YjgF/YER057c/UK114 family)|nr:hypothetical protein [Rhodospirillaceae bacterium]MDP6404907.1 RidA family protein [Alphaproteobacteria bacterium]MDP6621561.1 RidA family protein [Alphaproteobacteria bacterium]|tara:strand:- start:557 stop:904 length:348 start_codon:yes stop_codon:yes gene_type:complete